MKLERTPITKPFEPMKAVTLYQVNRNDTDGFFNNMRGCFVPMSRMEPVFSALMSGDVDAILDECFNRFNADGDISQSFLNYSISVGDVIKVNSDAYRCLPCGWEKV